MNLKIYLVLIFLTLGGVSVLQAQSIERRAADQVFSTSNRTQTEALLNKRSRVLPQKELQSERFTLQLVDKSEGLTRSASQASQDTRKVIYLSREDLNQVRASRQSVKSILNQKNIQRRRIEHTN